MQEAETLFFADSVCCCQLLDTYHLTATSFPLYLFAAFGILHFLNHLVGDLPSMLHHLIATEGEGSHLTGFREQAKPSLAYAKSIIFQEKRMSEDDLLFSQLDCAFHHLSIPLASYHHKIEEMEQRRALENTKANIIDTLIHMHCNRLLGTDPQLEKKARVIAWFLLKKIYHQREVVRT